MKKRFINLIIAHTSEGSLIREFFLCEIVRYTIVSYCSTIFLLFIFPAIMLLKMMI